MSVSCDPTILANNAVCFSQCVPPGEQLALQTYLLAQMAASIGAVSSADPNVLLSDPNVAKFNQTIPIGMQIAVQNYLLCQLVNK